MRVLFFLFISISSFGQIPLWQLEYAPDSTKMIGAAADGEPIWVDKGGSIIFIEGDSLYTVVGSDTTTVGYLYQGAVYFLGTPYDIKKGDFYKSTNLFNPTATKNQIWDGSSWIDFDQDIYLNNEGSLSVGAGTGTTSIINSNTSGSTGVTIAAGSGLGISESGNVITLTNTHEIDIDSIYTANDSIFLRDGNGFGLLPKDAITSVSYGSDTLTINTESGVYKTEIVSSTGGMDSLYNGDRPISRVPTEGQNLGATTFRQWLDWWYIGNASPPTLTMNTISPTLVEVGTSNSYTLSGTLTNSCSYTIGTRLVDGTSWSGSSYSKSVTFAPTSATTQTYSASAAWTNAGSICAPGGASSGTATASRSTQSVHPILWGMSATSYTGGSVPYNIWSKRIAVEGNQTGLTMTGTSQYIYILIPKSWSDFTVASIIDHNGFNVTPSFTAYDVTVTSTGLVNNWTQNYKLYKLNTLTTASGFNYIYNR